jgi:hypothetical protein
MPESPFSAQLNARAQILQSSRKGWRDPQCIIECAVDFCSIVEGHAELGLRTATEDVLINFVGNELLRRIDSVSGAADWLRFANRVGAQPNDVERLELGVSGILAAVDSGEEFGQRAMTAMRSALRRLAGTESGPDGDSVPTSQDKKPPRKRSTEPGEARIKIISALTAHHQHENGSCGSLEPIGVRELADKADVGVATVSDFFASEFKGQSTLKGHARYRATCNSAARLAPVLMLLNSEYRAHILLDRFQGESGGEDANE